MTKYALIVNKRVNEIFIDPQERFNPEFVSSLIQCPDSVEAGWYFIEGEWLAELPADPITNQDINLETNRRMQVFVGATDRTELIETIQKANREAIALLKVGSDNWTTEQTTRAAELDGADQMLNAISQAGRALKAMEVKPTDYQDDKYWP